jgi:hypothetical protein
VAAFLKPSERVVLPPGATGGPAIASLLPVLSSLRAFLHDVANAGLNNGLDSLQDALRINADVPISIFVTNVASASMSKPKGKGKKGPAPMDERLVDNYVKRLEAALGDDGKFGPLHAELCADVLVQQAEAVAIASQFYGQTPKSTSRSKALKLVRERQDKLMKFKRQPSTAGRPAA